MNYLVTARKWRPMVFEDVVGQSHIATTLRNAIATNRLSHAYLFSGPRGVGKTTTARILAKAINCVSPKDFNPDNKCEICREITEGRSIDVFEIDGASNRGVDEIRNLRESVRYPPAKGRYKVYIIDEVHMLTKEAFNALLKTLEEPPPHILFIFATTEVHKVPPTIISRCQRFDFRRISTEEITRRLQFIAEQEHISIDDDAFLIIAKKADGSLRDAQSIFDQVVSFGGERIDSHNIIQALNIVDEELYFRVTDLIHTKDTKGGLSLVEEIITRGYDIKEFLSGLSEHLRNLLIVMTMHSTRLVETSAAHKKRYEDEARKFSETDVLRLLKIVSDISASLRWSDQPRFRLEVGLLQMIKLDSSVRIDELLQELETLKKKIDPQHNHRGDLKVAGTVNASPPTKAVVSTPVPRYGRSNHSISSELETKHLQTYEVGFTTFRPIELQSTSVVSRSTVSIVPTERENQPGHAIPMDAPNKWGAFVDAASKQKVMVGTMLRESHVIDFVNNTLRVECPDDVHLSMLARNREFLVDLAHQIYGDKIGFETILTRPLEETTRTNHEHPIIAALKRELGAEPIE